MTNQELYYDILKKKYNILKKNLIIIEQSEEKINEFKNTIKNIDEIEQEKFKKDLESKKELTTTLEDEYRRLFDYITLIEERHRKRMDMLNDYNNIVKESLAPLEEIEDYDNIDFYSRRLDDISEFLNNNDKYEKLSEEKENYVKSREEYEEKYNSLRKLIDDFELNLLIKLKNSINSNDIYNKLDFDNLDDSISLYEEKLIDKEKQLSTYLGSYNALVGSNITDEEKEDYLNFINEEKDEYLDLLEKKYILLIYKYVNSNNKEDAVKVYEERVNKLNKYDLIDNSNLKDIFDIINNFLLKKSLLEEIELTMENIDNNINEYNEKIDNVKIELNKDNIKNLLKEFCIEKEYIDNNIDMTIEDDEQSEENSIANEVEDDNKNLIEIIDNSEVDNYIELEDDKKESSIEILNNLSEFYGNDNYVKEDIQDMESSVITEDSDTVIESVINNNSEVIDENKSNLNNSLFHENEAIFEVESSNVDERIVEDEIQKNNEFNDVEETIVLKDNSILDVKEIGFSLNIDDIRQKALGIMKSVCESVI